MSLDLSWITPVLAVGARIAPDHVPSLARDHGIAAIVDLRTEECDDEHVLRAHGIAFLHLPTIDRCGVALAMLDDGVAFVTRHLDAGERTLIHCQHGIGRSAILALCVLVARGLAPLDALLLAKDRRAAVSPSPEQYEAWAAWLRASGREPPPFEDFARIAYRHLGPS